MRFIKNVSVTAIILAVGLMGLYVLTEIINYVKSITGIY